MSNLTKPTIHLNGTSGNDLLDQYQDAITALNNAREYVSKTCPHGRDYYVQSPDGTQKARSEHCDRLKKIESVIEELEELALHALDQINK